MEETHNLHFPYEFKSVSPEEQELVDKNYVYTSRLFRLGPKGYITYEGYKRDAANIYNMPLRPTDIFVASYQRSGTTWTQELVWLLANNLDYKKAAEIPLIHRYPFLDMFQFIDPNKLDAVVKLGDPNVDPQQIRNLFMMMSQPVSGMLATMPSPRFVKTHLPMSLLNPKLLDTAKVVYIARDPRDVAVSCYHHARLFKVMEFPGEFKEFWNLFYKGLFVFCPTIEHVKEAWAMRQHPNMLFLFYEELSKDLRASINRVAKFLDKKLNEEEMERLCDHLSIENFKKNKSVNFEEMRELGLLATNESFVRKGKTGGWRDYFDEEMTQQAEQWINDSLRDTDLRYPQINC